MNVTDVLALRVDAAAVILSAISVSFGFISAHITGLYFFLHRAPLLLRLAAFVLLSLSLMFVVLIAMGVRPLAGGIVTGSQLDSSLRDLVNREVSSTAMVQALTSELPLIYVIGWSLGVTLAASVYMALAYLTFIHR